MRYQVQFLDKDPNQHDDATVVEAVDFAIMYPANQLADDVLRCWNVDYTDHPTAPANANYVRVVMIAEPCPQTNRRFAGGYTPRSTYQFKNRN